jgi:hypothetical protein
MVGVLSSLAALGFALPTTVLVLECLAGLLPPLRRLRGPGARRPTIAIVVPAHDEEGILGETLRDLATQVEDSDRIVVVADNCSDRTAEIARSHGARVLERVDPMRRGKGHAITFALDALDEDPPDVVVVFDADCRASPGAIDAIARLAHETGRPVQAEYILQSPRDPSLRTRVSAFAIRVRNQVRARGLSRLAGTCQLVGSGMAFPWGVLRRASAQGGHLVEDLALGVDAALQGHPPIHCSDVQVTSVLPTSDEAALTQRRRWETGHLSMLGTASGLVRQGILRRDRALFGLGLDLAVPPLSLLALGLLGGAAGGALALASGAVLPALALAVETGAVASALVVVWVAVGREDLPPRALLGLPLYLVWKLPVYLRFVRRGPERIWVRTARGSS